MGKRLPLTRSNKPPNLSAIFASQKSLSSICNWTRRERWKPIARKSGYRSRSIAEPIARRVELPSCSRIGFRTSGGGSPHRDSAIPDLPTSVPPELTGLSKSTPARDLITKQKQRQAEQECTRQDEKHALRYIRHVEISPCPSGSLAAW